MKLHAIALIATLVGHLSAAVRAGIQKRFAQVLERREHVANSVGAGREYVAAYVDYVHFVEALHKLVSHGTAHQHHQ